MNLHEIPEFRDHQASTDRRFEEQRQQMLLLENQLAQAESSAEAYKATVDDMALDPEDKALAHKRAMQYAENQALRGQAQAYQDLVQRQTAEQEWEARLQAVAEREGLDFKNPSIQSSIRKARENPVNGVYDESYFYTAVATLRTQDMSDQAGKSAADTNERHAAALAEQRRERDGAYETVDASQAPPASPEGELARIEQEIKDVMADGTLRTAEKNQRYQKLRTNRNRIMMAQGSQAPTE